MNVDQLRRDERHFVRPQVGDPLARFPTKPRSQTRTFVRPPIGALGQHQWAGSDHRCAFGIYDFYVGCTTMAGTKGLRRQRTGRASHSKGTRRNALTGVVAAQRQSPYRLVAWLTVVAMVAIAVLGPTAPRSLAASVTPIFVDETSNLTCVDFAVTEGGGQSWQEVKRDPPRDGTITVAGFGTITISNFTGKTFDFTSTFGIDAVYVKAGAGGSN